MLTESSQFDLTIRNGRISTADATFEADIGVRDGSIVAIARGLSPGRQDMDARGNWVLPGGIDSHCPVEQLSGMGMMCADDFYSATVSAAFGGTTTIIPFAAQHRGDVTTFKDMANGVPGLAARAGLLHGQRPSPSCAGG